MDWIHEPLSIAWLIFFVDLVLRLWFGARIIQRRLPASVAWAWLSLIFFVPFFGTLLYLFFGEYRQSRRRQKRLRMAQTSITQAIEKNSNHASIAFSEDSSDEALLSKAFQSMFGWPAVQGNDIQLLRNADEVFTKLVNDIDAATRSIDLEFYIWSDGGRTNDFALSLIRAVQRGVACRLLVDAIGSRQFINGDVCKNLRKNGVQVVVALPSGFWRSLIARPDLRIHRKIIVIDGSIGFTGSMNLADPLFFNRSACVGPWVDALARVRGPAVRTLTGVFLSDWCAETNEDFATLASKINFQNLAQNQQATIQCLPSGPAVKDSAIEQALIMCLSSARKEIVLTTPYFIPSEALLYALVSAARRGVKTTLVVPKKVDSRLTHHASRSFFQDLTAVGVNVALYKPGLLHTKSVTIDGKYCLFGSLNLDPRSLRINYEITFAIYDVAFTKAVYDLQTSYLQESSYFGEFDIKNQTTFEKWMGDITRLVGPLL
jgi:cardiolipin synthase A/B